MKVLLVSYAYPPLAGASADRAVDLARSLPALGIETHVLAPELPDGTDSSGVATQAWVHRVRQIVRPAAPDSGAGDLGARLAGTGRALGRRVLRSDEGASWNLTAIPAAVRLARGLSLDAVVTVGPPHSVHLIGIAVKRAARAAWLADLGGRPGDGMGWLVTRQSDAITCHSDDLADALRARTGGRPVASVELDPAASTADLLRSLA